MTLADDSVLFREGLARLLVDAGVEVVGQASDADELLPSIAAHRPDPVIVNSDATDSNQRRSAGCADDPRRLPQDVAVLGRHHDPGDDPPAPRHPPGLFFNDTSTTRRKVIEATVTPAA